MRQQLFPEELANIAAKSPIRLGSFCSGMGTEDFVHAAIKGAMALAGHDFQVEPVFKSEAAGPKLQFLRKHWPKTRVFFRDNAELTLEAPCDANGVIVDRPVVDVIFCGIVCKDVSPCTSTPRSASAFGETGKSVRAVLGYLAALSFGERPRGVLLECVARLGHRRATDPDGKRGTDCITEELQRLGYRGEWARTSPASFYLPQSRPRVYGLFLKVADLGPSAGTRREKDVQAALQLVKRLSTQGPEIIWGGRATATAVGRGDWAVAMLLVGPAGRPQVTPGAPTAAAAKGDSACEAWWVRPGVAPQPQQQEWGIRPSRRRSQAGQAANLRLRDPQPRVGTAPLPRFGGLASIVTASFPCFPLPCVAPSRPTESLEQVLRRCAEYAPSRAKAREPTVDGPEEGDVKWRDDHAAYKAKHGLTDDILKDNGSFMAQAALAFLPRQREALWLHVSKDLKEHGLPWEQGRPPEPDMQWWVWRPPPPSAIPEERGREGRLEQPEQGTRQGAGASAPSATQCWSRGLHAEGPYHNGRPGPLVGQAPGGLGAIAEQNPGHQGGRNKALASNGWEAFASNMRGLRLAHPPTRPAVGRPRKVSRLFCPTGTGLQTRPGEAGRRGTK